MARDPGEAEPDMRQMHDPQPRLAIAQDELCLARRRLRVIAGLGTLAARPQWRDDLAVGCNASAISSLMSSMCRGSVSVSFITASSDQP